MGTDWAGTAVGDPPAQLPMQLTDGTTAAGCHSFMPCHLHNLETHFTHHSKIRREPDFINPRSSRKIFDNAIKLYT